MNVIYQEINNLKANSVTSWHCHPYWQLDFVGTCQAVLEYEKKEIAVLPNHFILISPQLVHRIHIIESGTYNSFKFYCDFAPSEQKLFRKEPFCHYFELLKNYYQLSLDVDRNTVNCLLEALLLQLFKSSSSDQEESLRDQRIATVIQLIKKHPEHAYTIKELAEKANLSVNQFIRVFKSETGKTPARYLTAGKIEKAVEMLTYSDLSISQIADTLGFPDIYTFSRSFKRIMNVSPKTARTKMRKKLC